MKAAIIENGKVANIAKVKDQAFAESQGWIVSDTAKIGDTYDPETGEFISPPPKPEPVPTEVTKRQAKEQLIRDGMYQAALDAIAAIEDPIEQAIADNYWQESQVFKRDNATLNALAKNGMGLTDADLDSLFKAASKL